MLPEMYVCQEVFRKIKKKEGQPNLFGSLKWFLR
jgi:hypothetical protein